MLILNTTTAVSLTEFTDLKQMCREPPPTPPSHYHISRWGPHMDSQTRKNANNVRLSPCKIYTEGVAHHKGYSDARCKKCDSSLWSSEDCLTSTLTGRLQACLSHSSSSSPSVHCYVPCDTCCYFPPFSRAFSSSQGAVNSDRRHFTGRTNSKHPLIEKGGESPRSPPKLLPRIWLQLR